MRIAVVAGSFPSVSETFIRLQVNGLLRAGVDVEVFNLDHPGLQDPESPLTPIIFQKPRVPRRLMHRWALLLRRFPERRSWVYRTIGTALGGCLVAPRRLWLGSVMELFHILERLPFDLVHVHFGHLALRCADLPWTRHLPPLVTTFHGWDANVFPSMTRQDVYKSLFRRSHAFTVNSDFLKQRLLSLGCPAERIVKLPMGVDTSSLPFVARQRVYGEPLKLLSVGRLVPVKGHRFAIDAVAQLVRRGIDVQYTIVGGGQLNNELTQHARQLGISQRIAFDGPLPHDEVCRRYYGSHIFLLPSIRTDRGDEETQGVVVQEAQATGMPVIVTNVGGVAEGIVANRSGLVVRAGHATAIADAVAALDAQPSRWECMGRQGRLYVDQHFNSQLLLDELIAIYRRVILSSRGAERATERNRYG